MSISAVPAAVAVQAAEGLKARFDAEVIGVWTAPGRVNLIGEHTDYNDGFVFPFAINKRTAVALAPRSDRTLRVSSAFSDEIAEISLDSLNPENMSGWSAYVFGVAWALAEFGLQLGTPVDGVRGADLFVASDVPIGAGLSSSAAIECAVALALTEYWNYSMDRPTLAKVGQRAENVAVGAPTGIMDQSASLIGKVDQGVFLDCRSLDAEVIPLGFDAAGLSLLVMDTKVAHAHSNGGYASRRASCEKGAAAMGVESLRDLTITDLDRVQAAVDDETFRRVRHVVTENARVLETVRTLREHGPAAIGALLDASHDSMRDDFEISVPELDLAVTIAQESGAIGARMTGGGFGGAAIALVSNDLVDSITERVKAAFAANNYKEPVIFTVWASEGARRDI